MYIHLLPGPVLATSRLKHFLLGALATQRKGEFFLGGNQGGFLEEVTPMGILCGKGTGDMA